MPINLNIHWARWWWSFPLIDGRHHPASASTNPTPPCKVSVVDQLLGNWGSEQWSAHNHKSVRVWSRLIAKFSSQELSSTEVQRGSPTWLFTHGLQAALTMKWPIKQQEQYFEIKHHPSTALTERYSFLQLSRWKRSQKWTESSRTCKVPSPHFPWCPVSPQTSVSFCLHIRLCQPSWPVCHSEGLTYSPTKFIPILFFKLLLKTVTSQNLLWTASVASGLTVRCDQEDRHWESEPEPTSPAGWAAWPHNAGTGLSPHQQADHRLSQHQTPHSGHADLVSINTVLTSVLNHLTVRSQNGPQSSEHSYSAHRLTHVLPLRFYQENWFLSNTFASPAFLFLEKANFPLPALHMAARTHGPDIPDTLFGQQLHLSRTSPRTTSQTSSQQDIGPQKAVPAWEKTSFKSQMVDQS